MKGLRALGLLTAGLTFPLIGFGAIVRLKGAGLGCPDWPLCYGKVTPLHEVVTPAPEGLSIALEVGHRYVAGLVGLLTLALLAWAWTLRKQAPSVLRWSVVSLLLLAPQVILGGLTVTQKLAPWTVSLHLVFGNLFWAALVVLNTRIAAAARGERVAPARRTFGVAAVGTLALTFLQLVLGGWTSASGAGFSCMDFPGCSPDLWLPPGSDELATLQMVHRGVGVLVLLAFGALAALGMRDKTLPRGVQGAPLALVGLVLVQILVGWYNVAHQIPVPTSALHTAIAAAIVGLVAWVASKGVVMQDAAPLHGLDAPAPPPATEQAAAPARGLGALRAYYQLTKPGILRLLLVSTFCPMLVAARGFPGWEVTLWTLLGMALVSGSANALNMVYDRDIDAIMERTRKRPLPAGLLTPRAALIFAITIGVLGTALLAFAVNPLTAATALSGHLFYVLIYTMWLKRSTPQNIVIGGAAGAVPPLVGWAAVTGTLALPAWIMFAIIFLWTPPHFWALSLYKRGDYAAANVPMLPVVRGVRNTKLQMVWYALLLLPVSIVLGYTHDAVGPFYLLSALILGAAFCFFCVKTMFAQTDLWPKRTFLFSLLYLALLFLAMSIDSVFWGAPALPSPVELPLQPISATPPA